MANMFDQFDTEDDFSLTTKAGNKDVLANGNEIIKTANHFIIILNPKVIWYLSNPSVFIFYPLLLHSTQNSSIV